MTAIKSQPSDASTSDSSLEIQHQLRALDRKAWWHWWNVSLVIFLLTGAIATISLPETLDDPDLFSRAQLDVTVSGLLGLVLIFNVYVLYQEHLLRQARSHLSKQIEIATEQRVQAGMFRELAILDPLTGLYNRRYADERLRAEMARADRGGDPLAAITLDLDDFKEINDRYGHTAGDLVLKEFGRRLRSATRGIDISVRLGGDEFLIILPGCASEQVHRVLSRLGPFGVDCDGKRIAVSSSRGWAQYHSGETAQEFIKRADEALYEHKASRNLCRLENLTV